MIITSDARGCYILQLRLEQARQELPSLLEQAATQAGEQVRQRLSDAAPHGSSGGTSPQGDAQGPLADSFSSLMEAQATSGVVVSVRTDQPTKLSYVTKGTGIYGPRGQRIVPVKAKALFWEGADHPYRSVAGQKPNDFVTPVVADPPQAEDVMQSVIDGLRVILEGGA